MTYDRLVKLYLWLSKRSETSAGYWTQRKLLTVYRKLKQVEASLVRSTRDITKYL